MYTLIVKQIVTSPQVTCSRCAFEDNQDEKKPSAFASLNLSYHISNHYSNPTLHLYKTSQKSKKKKKLTKVSKEQFAHRHGQNCKHQSIAFKIVKCKEKQYDLFQRYI